MLTRGKESDTYLATVSRHRWSLQIAMKVDSSADEGCSAFIHNTLCITKVQITQKQE